MTAKGWTRLTGGTYSYPLPPLKPEELTEARNRPQPLVCTRKSNVSATSRVSRSNRSSKQVEAVLEEVGAS